MVWFILASLSDISIKALSLVFAELFKTMMRRPRRRSKAKIKTAPIIRTIV
jgi:hypothetical protein